MASAVLIPSFLWDLTYAGTSFGPLKLLAGWAAIISDGDFI